ncbi:regulator of G-protein signaling domain-containing protein [Sedimentitalea todarodis]|nr:hypothetical protein [Sedimentitalea todarodis]
MEIMADRALGKLYRAFVKSRMAEENTLFLDAVAKRFDPKKLYPKFIDPKATSTINVAYPDRKEAMDLAEANDFKNTKWKTLMQSFCDQIESLLDKNFLESFWKYKPFLNHHRAQAERKMKGDPRKAAELLGISDTGTMKSLMVAHAVGDQKEFKTMTAKLAAVPELKKKKVKSSMITKMLLKAKLI